MPTPLATAGRDTSWGTDTWQSLIDPRLPDLKCAVNQPKVRLASWTISLYHR
jgi:hypothetical protein